MKIERMTENKIKITIGNEDIKMWNVDLKNFTDNTPEAQDMFWFALKRAEQDVNFTVGKAQLLVETMKSEEDGFVMFVSRMENETELAEALIRAGKAVRRTELKSGRKNIPEPLFRIFRFKDFEDVCRGVSCISEMFLGTSKLWKHDGEFYLELLPIDSFGIFEIENILSEFADKSKTPLAMQGILGEYGKLMIKSDAIAVICRHFKA